MKTLIGKRVMKLCVIALALLSQACAGTYVIRTQDVKDVFRGNTTVAALDIQNNTDCLVRLRSYPFDQALTPGETATFIYKTPLRSGRSHRREVTVTPVRCSVTEGDKKNWSFSENRSSGTNVRVWLIEKTRTGLRFR